MRRKLDMTGWEQGAIETPAQQPSQRALSFLRVFTISIRFQGAEAVQRSTVTPAPEASRGHWPQPTTGYAYRPAGVKAAARLNTNTNRANECK